MVRSLPCHNPTYCRSPHGRGDGPNMYPVFYPLLACSPRVWGWSGLQQNVCRRDELSPHLCGDDPITNTFAKIQQWVLPTWWGWSKVVEGCCCNQSVLPTCVGMVRIRSGCCYCSFCSPHGRGDGPQVIEITKYETEGWFSPRGWGWSVDATQHRQRNSVSPREWGCSVRRGNLRARHGRSPHGRGDGPQVMEITKYETEAGYPH